MFDCQYNEKDSRPEGEAWTLEKRESAESKERRGVGSDRHKDTVATEERPGFRKNSADGDSVLSRSASGEWDEEREFRRRDRCEQQFSGIQVGL